MDSRRIEMMLTKLDKAREEFEQSVQNTRETFDHIEETLQSELQEEGPSLEQDVGQEIDVVHNDLTEIKELSTFCEVIITGGKEDKTGEVKRDPKNPAIRKRARKDELNITPRALAEALDKRDRELAQEKRAEYDSVSLIPPQDQ